MRPGRQEVTVVPSVLQWARESMGLTVDEVAKRLRLTTATVTAWESGNARPTLRHLEELSTYLKRPLAAFFLPKPPEDLPLPTDFRSLPAGKKPFSEKTRLALRRARRLQSLFHDLSEGPRESRSTEIGSASLQMDTRRLAQEARTRLEVTIETQMSWPDERVALDEWARAVESRGVLVLEASFPLEEGRAFSFADETVPAVVLNTRDAPTGRTFSLFHEYCHLLIRQDGICDLSDTGKTIEQFCNRFAAEFLVPERALVNQPGVTGHALGQRWEDEDLGSLAKLFKVSREVILRRLLSLGRTTVSFYEKKCREWEHERKATVKRRKAWRVPARDCVRNNGVRFTSAVLESARQERITYRDVSDYLSIALKHLPKVEEILQRDKALHA